MRCNSSYPVTPRSQESIQEEALAALRLHLLGLVQKLFHVQRKLLAWENSPRVISADPQRSTPVVTSLMNIYKEYREKYNELSTMCFAVFRLATTLPQPPGAQQPHRALSETQTGELFSNVFSLSSLCDVLKLLSFFYIKRREHYGFFENIANVAQESRKTPVAPKIEFRLLLEIFTNVVSFQLRSSLFTHRQCAILLHSLASLPIAPRPELLHQLLKNALAVFLKDSSSMQIECASSIPEILQAMVTAQIYNQRACTLFPRLLGQGFSRYLSSREVEVALVSLHALRVFHEGITKSLIELAERPWKLRGEVNEEASSIYNPTKQRFFEGSKFDINILVRTAEKVAAYKTLLSDAQFAVLLLRVVQNVDSLWPPTVAKLFHLLSLRDITTLIIPMNDHLNHGNGECSAAGYGLDSIQATIQQPESSWGEEYPPLSTIPRYLGRDTSNLWQGFNICSSSYEFNRPRSRSTFACGRESWDPLHGGGKCSTGKITIVF